MHFPQFWKKVDDGKSVAWGWSDTSAGDAETNARGRAQRIRTWLSGGGERKSSADIYGYPDRPMREEVLREFPNTDGRTNSAAVSRNSMGCLVLNTTNLMFVDVDLPEPPATSGGGLLSMLFGRKKENPIEQTAPDPQEIKIKATVDAWLQSHPGWGWRVYRTKAGFRLMATHAPITAQQEAVKDVFTTFGADPLYRNLCDKQDCFRARLTAKPWRCKVPRLQARWPWDDAKAEGKFRAWEQRYLDAAKDFATCKLIGHFGSTAIHPALSELVEFHDQATRIDTTLPLA